MSSFYTLNKAKYLYKDQYNKHVFEVEKKNSILDTISKKCKEYDTINPVYQKNEDSPYNVRFNSTEFNLKAKCFYDISFYIQKNVKEDSKKVYINLHINECIRLFKKNVIKCKLDDL